jgi:hypothetical protein
LPRHRQRLTRYTGSTAAMIALAAQRAGDLMDGGLTINAADSDFTAADLNDRRRTQTGADGAVVAARLARC